MNENLHFVGIDVDDQNYHYSIIDKNGDTIVARVKCRRDASALLKSIKNHIKGKNSIVVGYEATYVGYTLYRFLRQKEIDCKVIVPTSIAKAPNDRVKNDGIDSYRLAIGLYRKEFKFVAIPSKEQEADRQLIRARSFLVQQQSDLKRHILSQCRLCDLDYKKESGNKDYWTKEHRNWLDKSIKTLPSSFHITLSILLQQLESFQRQITSLDNEISHQASQEQYKKQVKALSCFKGISELSAMTILTEIFDINRFAHPRQLVAYLGLDIREYSSGGKQNQYGISKMGSRRLRTVLVEACQLFWRSKTPSKRKEAERRGSDAAIIKIADRCQERLYKKGHRLLAREKKRNQVKVACAREMVGFLWESLKIVA